MKAKYTEQFEQFWRQYPNVSRNGSGQKTRGNKKEAWLQWKRLSLGDKLSALEGVKNIKPDPYLKNAVRWLKYDGWENEDNRTFDASILRKKTEANKQELRESGTACWLKEQTPEKRQEYVVAMPCHKWLVDEIERAGV